jgi:hypothetical protein
MLETPDEIERLQDLLDRSAAGAGPHLRGILTDERQLSAARLCQLLTGLRLLVVATVTADGRPLAGPVDGYFLHGSFYFSSGRNSVRMCHLAPAVCRLVRVNPGCAPSLIRFQPFFAARSARCSVMIRSASLDWA